MFGKVLRLLLLGACATLSAAPLLARDFVLPESVRGGQTITLRWTVESDVDELELLLSGPDFSTELRLTPQLSGHTASIQWNVPNLDLDSARISLRVGTWHGESVIATSEPFRIVADARYERALIDVHEGEWWVDRSAQPLDPSSLGDRHSFTASSFVSDEFDRRPDDTLPSSVETPAALRPAADVAVEAAALPLLRRTPRDIPQRK
jgi:hypothetical protein